jgi:hypothetical protein
MLAVCGAALLACLLWEQEYRTEVALVQRSTEQPVVTSHLHYPRNHGKSVQSASETDNGTDNTGEGGGDAVQQGPVVLIVLRFGGAQGVLFGEEPGESVAPADMAQVFGAAAVFL